METLGSEPLAEGGEDSSSVEASESARPGGVLWDVVDEHLEEATYGITRMVHGLDSSTLTLGQLSRYPEERLSAHVDALVLGGALGWGLSRIMFQVSPFDAGTLATAAGLLGLASLAAAFIPAWRAASISPSTAIRATD